MINTDGSVQQPSSKAAAGGLMRDHTGKCMNAFISNLGICTITRAEIKAAIQGLRTRFRKYSFTLTRLRHIIS
ncbi:unnamed protein product [Linum tenue]|uniref:RNase H type-1 domain-containing protein n=1 Tax=Linum tenue TaxID=586396 RepID=A0AAV0IK96_9ROSI|nr:unnamed protein product [Linum tenue]